MFPPCYSGSCFTEKMLVLYMILYFFSSQNQTRVFAYTTVITPCLKSTYKASDINSGKVRQFSSLTSKSNTKLKIIENNLSITIDSLLTIIL